MDFLSTASNFLAIVWDLIVNFFTFLVNSGSRITSFLEFILSVVLEIPDMLINVFKFLPDFMQTGLAIVYAGVVLVLVLKIIKLIRDVTI